MSEDNTNLNQTNQTRDDKGTTGDDGQDEQKFEAVTSQGDLDRIVGERLARERKKFEHYEDYKKAAEKLKKIEDKDKTELQKLQERFEKAEKENAAFKQRQQASEWAREISGKTGVPAEILRGSTKEEMEAHAEELKKYTNGNSAPFVSSDGKKPKTKPGGTIADIFADAIDGLL